MKKVATPEEAAHKAELDTTRKPARGPFKMEVSATLFIERGTHGLNCLEANNEYGDTCLHPSVSKLTHHHGIRFKHQSERITNRAGLTSRFTRYSLLSETDVLRAKKLINHFRSRRGLSPINWEVVA